MIKPPNEIHFWAIIFPLLICQKPTNHAAGMEASVDPNEYGREAIPAENGVIPFTA